MRDGQVCRELANQAWSDAWLPRHPAALDMGDSRHALQVLAIGHVHPATKVCHRDQPLLLAAREANSVKL